MKKNIPISHVLLSAVFDFFFLAIISMSILALVSFFANRIVYTPLVALSLFVLIVISIFVYYLLFRKKEILSFGENIMGFILIKNKKEYANPYQKNRWWIFVMFFMTLLLLGNDWDVLETNIIPIGVVIGKIIKFILIFFSMLLIGSGKVRGVFVPLIVFCINVVISFLLYQFSGIEMFFGAAFFYSVLVIGYLLIYVFYKE